MNDNLISLLTSPDPETVFLGICFMNKYSFGHIETINLFRNIVRDLNKNHHEFFEEHKEAIADKVEELCSPYFWDIFEGVLFRTDSNLYRLD